MIDIRTAQDGDEPFLWDMLWEAMAVHPEMRSLGREAALALPQVRHYLENWGRPGDAAVLAVEEDGRRFGAAWYRLFPADDPGYGFVAPDIPEVTIAVAPGARGLGIGGAMLDSLLALALVMGHKSASLSVDRWSPARRLYKRKGFRDAGISNPDNPSVTLIVTL